MLLNQIRPSLASIHRVSEGWKLLPHEEMDILGGMHGASIERRVDHVGVPSQNCCERLLRGG